ncbi:BREX-2 system phosphatase PglZ [Amnibacterium soli]|uniref:BREX-2 system phosphatase PglZ n=1 Tax=Amnibacterium soli TaxID=1282736 RepID=A0ABP8YX57_9MICO
MTAPTVTETALREHLTTWLTDARRRSRTILVRAQPAWSGAPALEISGEKVRIVEGVSGLAALDAMRAADKNEFVAVLTALTEAELGTPVVLEVEKQRVTDLDEWNVLPALFGVRDAPARPVRDLGSWVPRFLTSLRHDRGFPPAPGGVLTADHVVRSALVALLGLHRLDALESSTALAPLDDAGVRARLDELGQDAREGFIRAVATHVDSHLAMALRAVTAPGRVSAISVGLVVGELWAAGATPPDATVAAARVRAERYIGPTPSAVAAQRYGASAKLITQRWLADGDQHSREVLEQAEALCGDLGWTEGAAASDFLPAGLRARVAAFAASIEAAAAAPNPRASLTVDDALTAIEAHGARATFARSSATARMAARLVRWLVQTAPPTPGLTAAMLSYATDGAWAERALGDIWDGDTDRGLAQAYRTLAHAVQAVRRQQDAAAAATLTGELVADDAVLPIESLLSRLVVPLTTRDRVLLIVLDGMSAPTGVEIAAGLPAQGWTELVQAATLRRGAALAVLPTVTEYSRTSLFAGELLAGNQQIEKSRFAAAVGGIVFHKDDLRAEAGHALPPAVSDAIADSGRKVVGVVLNTIDDSLASADADSLRWTLHSVAHLEAVLAAAQNAGRTIILTSDHGHVVERGSELRSVPQSPARWRDASTGPSGAHERLVTGPRVLAPGGTAVLAVSDGLRYASKKAGYHGGASLAELTIPLIVIKPRGVQNPDGWVEAPPQEPTWWNEPARASVEMPPAPVKPTRSRTTKVPVSSAALFDLEPDAAMTPGPSGRSIGERLIDSPIYKARRGIAGRHPVDDSVAVTILTTLTTAGGRAHRDTLAVRAAVPGTTMAGLLAALRRVLNVDGYPVIDMDADGATVVLDLKLLEEQFELGAAS